MKRMNDRTNETGAEALEKVHATPVFASTGWEPVEAEDPDDPGRSGTCFSQCAQ